MERTWWLHRGPLRDATKPLPPGHISRGSIYVPRSLRVVVFPFVGRASESTVVVWELSLVRVSSSWFAVKHLKIKQKSNI